VRGQWKRGHFARGVGGGAIGPAPLPDGDGRDDLDGLDDMEPDPEPAPPAGGWRGAFTVPRGPGVADAMEPPPAEPEPPRPDPPAAKIGAGRPRAPRRAGGRITAAVRNDVEGKFGLMLEMGGRVFEARDPVCGGVFMAQVPAIRSSAVELILLSPDLVEWFTGVGGGFMLWFNLAAALWPVGLMAWAHHITHAVGQDQDQAAGPAVSYAA
jgi:hypothetical protein